MVKVEDCTDSGSSSDVEILERQRLQVTLSDLKPGSVPHLVDEVVYCALEVCFFCFLRFSLIGTLNMFYALYFV
ncbi:hypothetical protein GW17_00022772 [Ensete ventricosum]|uniref:Uncharacterized protein n=1 Tax=Ensete ventricosum TaxID=4639 RepID=A0A444ET31_ENSVE|nr:hypothetical protein GW17_00022772 [Ensete ventricosum]RZR73055.1 hypothetical protein BHM03_00019651 [Ensete ventricosum]